MIYKQAEWRGRCLLEKVALKRSKEGRRDGKKEGGRKVVWDLGGSIGKAVGRGGTYTSIGF